MSFSLLQFEMKQTKIREFELLMQMNNVANDVLLRSGYIDYKEWDKRNEDNLYKFKSKVSKL